MMLCEYPKVSCLIVSELIPKDLVESFRAQVYAHKELIVLNKEQSHYDTPILYKKADLPDDWMKDLAIELATGDIVCWWNENDPHYLSRRVHERNYDEIFFPKQYFYEAQNMLYCKSEVYNKEYFNEV